MTDKTRQRLLPCMFGFYATLAFAFALIGWRWYAVIWCILTGMIGAGWLRLHDRTRKR